MRLRRGSLFVLFSQSSAKNAIQPPGVSMNKVQANPVVLAAGSISASDVEWPVLEELSIATLVGATSNGSISKSARLLNDSVGAARIAVGKRIGTKGLVGVL